MRHQQHIPSLRPRLALSLMHALPIVMMHRLDLRYHLVHPLRHVFHTLAADFATTAIPEDLPALLVLQVDVVRGDALVLTVVPLGN